MKMFDQNGMELMNINSMEPGGENLIIRGMMMGGTMPAVIILKPEEIWGARKLLGWSVFWHLISMIFRGMRSANKHSIENQAETKTSDW